MLPLYKIINNAQGVDTLRVAVIAAEDIPSAVKIVEDNYSHFSQLYKLEAIRIAETSIYTTPEMVCVDYFEV